MIDLSEEVKKIFDEYSKEVKITVNESAERTAKKTKKHLRMAGNFKDKRGKYRKSWRVKKEIDALGNLICTVHASGKEYRLTHLLEYGHAMPNGGRAKAYPHIKEAEDLAINDFQEEVIREIEKL